MVKLLDSTLSNVLKLVVVGISKDNLTDLRCWRFSYFLFIMMMYSYRTQVRFSVVSGHFDTEVVFSSLLWPFDTGHVFFIIV